MNFRYLGLIVIAIVSYGFFMHGARNPDIPDNQPAVDPNLSDPNQLIHRARQVLRHSDHPNEPITQAEYTLARMLFEIVANQGDNQSVVADANQQLGIMYLNGLGTPVNRAQARTHFLRVAQQRASLRDAINANVYLGDMYAQIDQPDRDINQAILFYNNAINLANQQRLVTDVVCEAHLKLGNIYHKEQGNTPAAYAQARQHYEFLISESQQFFRMAIAAIFELVDMYFDGPATEVDYKRACTLCDRMIAIRTTENEDRVHALFLRGKLYLQRPNGVPDFVEAFQSFNRAYAIVNRSWAEDKYVAMVDYYLGLLYFNGQGTVQNFNLAKHHFKRLMENKHAPEDLIKSAQEYLSQIPQ